MFPCDLYVWSGFTVAATLYPRYDVKYRDRVGMVLVEGGVELIRVILRGSVRSLLCTNI